MMPPPLDDRCPSEEDIAAFVKGRFAPPHDQAIEAHVARCSPCRQLLSALARAAGALSGSLADSVSPTLPNDPSASLGADPGELQAGARFGRYVVLDWLGAGGMGVVYAAYDPELNRKVALKVLRGDGDEPARIHDLLLREAQAMAQLAHPNVVTVFDVGTVDGRVFIAMELVEGQTLTSWLAAERRTPREILAAFVAAGHGLAAAHAAGLVHRDFKPDNVLVGKDGRARVTDFGLARHTAVAPTPPASSGADAPRGGNTTRTGLVGTLGYMAPEQYQRRTADARADQFSFAVALYEALCGERPFGPLEPVAGAWTATPRLAASLRRDGVSPALRQALLRALAPAAEHRHRSMNDLLAALTPAPPRRGRLLTIGGVALVATAIASAGIYAIRLRRAAEQRTELVGHLRGLAPELRTVLQSAHMLPLHDIRPARDEVRRAIRDVDRQLQTPAGQDEHALVHFVLGEGYRALGDRKRALAALEAAWAEGERGPLIDAALGAALGDAYENELEQSEQLVQSSDRQARLDTITRRYGEPAMTHLRSALAAHASSPAYLEALIAYHGHHFAEASRTAHAAFDEAPTRYEAGVLEAMAHHATGQQLLAQGKRDEAEAELATARRIFERVLEIARSDDEAWRAYGEMVYGQALALERSSLQAELRQQAIAAFHTARQINPENWEALVREMEVYEKEANIAIVSYRDPGAYVDQVLALAREARAQGADSDQVDVNVCLASWERAVYQGSHGTDPRPSFQQAVDACERAAATRPDSDKYASLGAAYSSLANYEAEHGGDPARAFELGERNLRSAIAIDDRNAVLHYNLGRLWINLARHRESHGDDPDAAVARALSELETALTMDATRVDARAAMSDALIVRARFERAAHREAPTLARARRELEQALALRPDLIPPIRYRMMIEELDAEALLARATDPTATVARIEADAQLLLRRVPDDGFPHRLRCHAQLIEARWTLAHRHAAADRALNEAAREAAWAREADPLDARSWTASAEVEALRAVAVAAPARARAAAIASGRAFIAHAMKIDPRLTHTLEVRDELER